MKTDWQIVESPHADGARVALEKSRLRFVQPRAGMNLHVEVMPFTDETFLVVLKWSNVEE